MSGLLRTLQAASGGAILFAAAMGYGARLGWVAVSSHIPWGFFLALLVAFTHAMTIFYFAGIGVSLREACSGRPWAQPLLARAEALRRGLAWPLGLAIVALMATVILGGGSHTRWLPSWVHHVVALAALPLNLHACAKARRSIGEQEAIGIEAGERLDPGRSRLDGGTPPR